jgi:hypothetical protein
MAGIRLAQEIDLVPMKRIKLMADYGCFPLWGVSLNEIGNINPDDLPLSVGLKDDLLAWGRTYDQTLNMDDPSKSGFRTAEDESEFKHAGLRLGEKLKDELGEDFFVQVKV